MAIGNLTIPTIFFFNQGFSGISSSTAEHPWFRETAVFADNGSEEVEELEPIEPGSLDEIRKAIEAEAQKD